MYLRAVAETRAAQEETITTKGTTMLVLDTMEAELAEAKQLLGEAACGDCGSNLRGRIEAFLTKGGA